MKMSKGQIGRRLLGLAVAGVALATGLLHCLGASSDRIGQRRIGRPEWIHGSPVIPNQMG